MDNVVKLPSQQSLFNKTNRLVDLIIPGSSGIYDLSKTYVSINMNVSGVSFDVSGFAGGLSKPGAQLDSTDAVADLRIALQHNATKKTIYDSCAVPVEALVTNCSMFSAARGKVEDLRRSDILRSTMKAYTQDIDDVQDRALGGFAGMAKTSPWVSGKFAQLIGIGDTASEYRPHEIRIYLRDIFNIGSAEAWDSSVYGDTRIHLELALDRVKILQALTDSAAPGNAVTNVWERYYHNQQPPFGTSPSNAQYQTAKVLTLPAAGLTATSMEMMAQYDSLEDSPFFVNQLLTVVTTYGGTGSSAGTDYPTAGEKRWAVVKSISWDKTTKRVTLEIGGNIIEVGAVTGDYTVSRVVEGVTADGVTGQIDTATLLPVYDSIELTALIRSDMDSGPENIQYTQYMSQSDQWQNGSQLSRTYYLPPQTTNAVIVMPSKDNTGTAPTRFSDILGCARLNDYRFTLNGASVTNRAVPFMPKGAPDATTIDDKCECGGSLHYSLISETFLNMGKRYHSLSEAVYDQDIPMSTPREAGGGLTGWQTLQACPEKRVYMISLPVPISNEQQQLTIDLNGDFPDGSGELHIYSEIRSVV